MSLHSKTCAASYNINSGLLCEGGRRLVNNILPLALGERDALKKNCELGVR